MAAVAGLIGLCAMLVVGAKESPKRAWWRRVSPPAVLVVGWFLCAYLAFSPFNYRPVRYQVVIWLPLAAACGWFLQRLVSGHKDRSHSDTTRPAWWLLPFLAAILSIGLQHFVFARLLDPSGRGLSSSSQGASIAVALLLSAAWIYFGSRGRTTTNQTPRVRVWAEVLVAAFAVLIVAEQGRHFVRWWSEKSYALQEANDDLRRILSTGAVTNGEWGPPLCQRGDSPLSLTHFFSVAEPKTYFADNPITHVIVEDKPDGPWFKDFPDLSRGAAKITTYTIGHLRIGVWRVAEIGGNPRAEAYAPSFLERLHAEVGKQPMDSLLSGLTQRVADSANSYSGWAFAADLLHRANRDDEALDACRHALAFYPDDFVLLAQAGDLSWEKYRTVGGPQDRDEAVRYWTRAGELSPGNPGLADRLHQAGK
jgi:ABC-type nickel/cobalt efflux system permease component RcnA